VCFHLLGERQSFKIALFYHTYGVSWRTNEDFGENHGLVSTFNKKALAIEKIFIKSKKSVPLRREGFSRLKSFWYGQLSGFVEPIAGVIGAVAVVSMRAILPYALLFAAGAMIGFALMITLDIALS